MGRDGSPSRPFVERDTYVDRLPRPIRLNGGLGEPALPKAVTPEKQRETGTLAAAMFNPNPQPIIRFPVSLCSLMFPSANR